MTDKERIRAEIERLLKEEACGNEIAVYNDLLSFIDSLPENSAGDDLKNEIRRYADGVRFPMCYDSYTIAANHFADWQKQQMMKDAVEAVVNTYEEIGGEGYVEFVANVPPSKYKEKITVKLIIMEEG